MATNNQKHMLMQQISEILKRLDLWLPEPNEAPNWQAIAYQWQRVGKKGVLRSLANPHTFPIVRLANIDQQVRRVIANTEQFLKGYPANNVLLTGARGTGKSSLIKALLHRYAVKGLRLVQIDKDDLQTLSYLLDLVQNRPEKFIIFCDDLSFKDGEGSYQALKTVLDGGLISQASNTLIYATSNRRHLMPQRMIDNIIDTTEEEVFPRENIEDKTALAERFGLWLTFYPFSQEDYLAAVKSWLQEYNCALDSAAQDAALKWAQARGNRSGRVAWQFVCDWVGKQQLQQNRA